jgi:hypothetical protein
MNNKPEVLDAMEHFIARKGLGRLLTSEDGYAYIARYLELRRILLGEA